MKKTGYWKSKHHEIELQGDLIKILYLFIVLFSILYYSLLRGTEKEGREGRKDLTEVRESRRRTQGEEVYSVTYKELRQGVGVWREAQGLYSVVKSWA